MHDLQPSQTNWAVILTQVEAFWVSSDYTGQEGTQCIQRQQMFYPWLTESRVTVGQDRLGWYRITKSTVGLAMIAHINLGGGGRKKASSRSA